MDFSLSEEQTLFRESVERFVADSYGFEARQRIVASAPGYLEEHWQAFAELGWLALPLPEAFGGLGGRPFDTLVLMEQLGRGLVVSPYFATVLLGGQALALAGREEQKADLLPALAEGQLKLALAYGEVGDGDDLRAVETQAEQDGAGYRLTGRKAAVLFAEVADRVVVTTRGAGENGVADGLSLFLLDPKAQGVSLTTYRTLDGGTASDIIFDRVHLGPEALLGEAGGAAPLLDLLADQARAALLAEAGGILWMIYEQTLEHLKTRKQFGQILGSFQALQHRMVELYMRCQLAQSLVIDATASLLAEDAQARRQAVSAAKYEVGRLARLVGQDGIQLHGAMGMMTEMPVGHAYKRLTMINATLGTPRHHLARYSQAMVAEEA